MTYLRSVLACLAAVVVLGPFTAPVLAAGSSARCSGVEVGLEWTSIAGPDFPSDPQRITAHAIAPRRPGRIWVTNGSDIMVTNDGGCKWREAFTLDDLPDLQMPVSKLTSVIRGIEVPEAASSQSEIYAYVEETIGPAKRPHVLASSDAGATWDLRDNGLPLVSGAAIEMNIAPSDPGRIYLLLQGSPVTNAQMWTSENAGASWRQTGEIGGANGFRIDPINRGEIWFSGTAIQHSTDGGRTVRPITYVTNPAPFVDAFRAPGKDSRIMAYEAESLAFTRSDDSGLTWQLLTAPPNVMLSVAHGNGADDIIASVHEGVYRFQAPFYWVEVTPNRVQGVSLDPDYEDIVDLQVERTEEPAAVGRRANSLMRYTGFSVALPSLEPQPPLEKTGAKLIGSTDKVKIPAGKSRKIDYRLHLPPQPTPLDVFFLVDTTESMESSINGMLSGIQRIASELNSAEIDVRFGVGEYKDYPIPGYGDPTQGDFPYRRNRDLGAADASLVAALEKMQATGGGGIPESQLTALYQAATGEGEPGCSDTGAGGADSGPTATRTCVPPDQGASFRGDALRVIINITDAPFDQSPAHPSPQFDFVSQELESRGVLQIGLAVYGPNGIRAARADLQRMAEGTGAVVPAGGVDCDGDGVRELLPGAPLVCDITDNERDGVKNLASAILASLRAVTDIAPVEVVATSGEPLIERISPAYPNVDVKSPQRLPFTVTYACPKEGKARAEVQLIGTVREASVADTATKVVCLPPTDEPIDPAVIPPVLAEIPLVAAAVAPPPPPPPAPVSQTQPQPNPNLQGAMAHQEQQQSQVAAVTETSYEEDLEEEYAMAAYEGRSRSPAAEVLLLYGAALAMSAAAAIRLRHRSHLARNRST